VEDWEGKYHKGERFWVQKEKADTAKLNLADALRLGERDHKKNGQVYIARARTSTQKEKA